MNNQHRHERTQQVAQIAPKEAEDYPMPNWAYCGTLLSVPTVAIILISIDISTLGQQQRGPEIEESTIIDETSAKRLDDAVRKVFPQIDRAETAYEVDIDSFLAMHPPQGFSSVEIVARLLGIPVKHLKSVASKVEIDLSRLGAEVIEITKSAIKNCAESANPATKHLDTSPTESTAKRRPTMF